MPARKMASFTSEWRSFAQPVNLIEAGNITTELCLAKSSETVTHFKSTTFPPAKNELRIMFNQFSPTRL